MYFPRIVIFLLVFSIYQNALAKEDVFQWQFSSPETQGMSLQKLDALRDTLAERGTKALLIVRHDKIIYEWYAPGFGPDRRHYTASLAKVLVGGMSLLLALQDGYLSLDDPAWKYIPEWKDDSLKSQITILQLCTHSSGIEDAEIPGLRHDQLPDWKGDFWKRSPDPFTIARDRAPIIFPPGTEYAYSNPGMAMLSYAVTASIQENDLNDIRSYLRQRIIKPIGIKDNEWEIGYGTTYHVNGLKLVANWGGGAYTARAIARIGRLMLHYGNWQGIQLIDSLWVKKAVAYAETPIPERPPGNPQPASGLCWYTNFNGVWPRVPRDAFAGAGAGNQVLLVIPSLDLIVVRNGSNLYDETRGEGFWGGLVKYLFNPLMDAIISAPYPHSIVIKSVTFAPFSSIIRMAKGSDNWPVTWADNDALYTAFGDGWGFEPHIKEKLSLGFARVEGMPPDIRGINIRSKTGERFGDGRKGAKASGMLMVDGVLYMLVRNTGNSQIAFSKDHGKTWQWCKWKFTTSFGCPTFLNFGKNYNGARDDFVYIYSPDSEDAYSPADRMVLARVPKDQILNRKAYEFLKTRDVHGNLIWAKSIEERGAVFVHPARCYRSSVSYNPALKRYLLCQTIPGDDLRFKGGFGIYDAPEPWGPWTTVFFTTQWDIGPGETCSLPTKWMSKDGKECYLLFSGDDSFSVRKLTFQVCNKQDGR